MKRITVIHVLGLILLLLFLAACEQPFISSQDGDGDVKGVSPMSSSPPRPSLPDQTDPEDHFFFLPPISAKPEFSGTFAADLQPAVRFVQMDGDDELLVAEFTTEGQGSEQVRIESSDELGSFYIVNLHAGRFMLDPESAYRIVVSVDGRDIGSIDVDVVPQGPAKNLVDTTQFVPLSVKQTLPIKFRIEEELFAVPTAGYLVAWGASSSLLDVPEGEDFVDVQCGQSFGVALREDGSLVSWGYGPVAYTPTGNNFVSISANSNYGLALNEDGSIVKWGSFYSPPPGNDFVAIAAGSNAALALRSDGSLAVWGSSSPQITDLPTGSDFIAIAAGGTHMLALQSDGSIAAWGQNGPHISDTPAESDFIAISAGFYFSLAIRSDGSLAGWGQTYRVDTLPAGNDFIAIASNDYHDLALREDGTVEAWGQSSYGKTIVPEDLGRAIAIAPAGQHSVAIVAPE